MSGTCAEHQRSHRMIADRKREPLTSASCRIRARPQRSAPRAPPTDTACSLISASSFVAHCAAYPKKSLLQTLGICTPPLAGPRCVAVSQLRARSKMIGCALRVVGRRPVAPWSRSLFRGAAPATTPACVHAQFAIRAARGFADVAPDLEAQGTPEEVICRAVLVPRWTTTQLTRASTPG